MTTGERIKKRRKELGLTQEELAKKLGNKSRASVCTVENDKEDLTTTRIRQYAEALECSPSYLMGWTDNSQNELSEQVAHLNKDHVDEAMNIINRYEHLPEDRKKEFQNYLRYLESLS